ncbi:MAG: ABC transporter ATP-binding protein/permease [Lachnospiraceae bacterium]|nr:ABC transporter ATP-binding protein/permease [Lachnospiraceae bacterium]
MSEGNKENVQKHSAKQVWSNNLFLIRLCIQASPAYVFFVTFDVVRNQISIFLEHTYGIGYILEAAEFHYPFKRVALFVLGLAIFVTVELVFSAWVANYIGAKNLPKVRQRVKLTLYEKASDMDLKCYDDPDYYNQLVLVLSEADKQIDRCITFLQNTFSGIAVFLTTGIYFFYKDRVSILFVTASFFMAFCFNQIYNRLTFQLRVLRNPLERKRDYVKRVFYMQDYAKELRLNPKTAEIIYQDFEQCNEEIYKVEKSYTGKRFWLSFLRRYISNDFMSDVVYVSYLVFRAVIMGGLSYSSVAILYNSFGRLKWSMSIFTDVYPYACETSLYVQKIRDFLAMQPELVSEKKLPVTGGAKEIEIRNICFTYGKAGEEKGQILNDISFAIRPGEKIAIVGYNGAGKTTLMKLIMRLYDPVSGQIIADGREIRDYDLQDYRKSIGTVFQDFKIFAGSVKENVLMDAATPGISEEPIKQALVHSGLEERLAALPNGIDTMMTTEFDNEGVNFSGGESQKLAISRVFYKDAGLIILDEPSSALDPIAEYQLNHAMLEMAEHRTVIFISHRLSTTRLADRIILMENGKIVEQGTHDSLLKAQGKYAGMWNVQAGQYLA